eukprot:3487859-Prymnesium_polylepis.2
MPRHACSFIIRFLDRSETWAARKDQQLNLLRDWRRQALLQQCRRPCNELALSDTLSLGPRFERRH